MGASSWAVVGPGRLSAAWKSVENVGREELQEKKGRSANERLRQFKTADSLFLGVLLDVKPSLGRLGLSLLPLCAALELALAEPTGSLERLQVAHELRVLTKCRKTGS